MRDLLGHSTDGVTKARVNLIDRSKRNRAARIDHYRAVEQRRYDRTKVARLVKQAMWRADRAGLPFDLRPQDVVIPAVCPVLGIAINRANRGMRDDSPSLDRIIPERGYVRGNIVDVSMLANRIKGNATVAQLRAIADFYERVTATRPE